MNRIIVLLATACLGVPVAAGAQRSPVRVVDPKPILRIGQVMGDSAAYDFTDINGMVVVGDSILVLEGSSDEVRVFDQHGRFLGRIGRKGEGPGEFLWPTALRRVPQGIAVVDLRLRRQSFFSLKGDSIRTEPLGRLGDQPLAGFARMRDSVSVAETEVMISAEQAHAERVLVVRNAGTEGVDTIAQYSTGYVPFRAPGTYGFLTGSAGSEGAWAVAGDSLLAVASGEPTELRWWKAEDNGMELKGHIGLPVQPVRFTRDDLRHLIEKTNEQQRKNGEAPLPRSVNADPPTYWGQVERLVVSDRMVCWIQWKRPRDEGDQQWFRLDLKTGHLERVMLPRGFHMLAASGENLYGYSLTELDTPIVTVYRFGGRR